MQDYVFVLIESAMHEGREVRGIFTSSCEAEEAMKQLKNETKVLECPGVYSFWVDRVNLNQIIRG
jgi:hypothetical protein